jgi:ABC-2 type transport system permease protein
MKPAPGSLLRLVAQDVTLNWRRFLDMFGRLSPVATWTVCIAGLIVVHLIAWRIMVLLPRLKPELDSAGPAAGAVPVFFVLAWISAQGLLGASRTLQERGGMDLMLASPLPVRLILAARLISIAASSFGSVALLVLPLANVAAILHGPAWLAAYPTLLALSLIGTVVGMAVAIALFLTCDPRRARSLAQLCAAVMGGAFLLAAQIAAILPAAARRVVTDYLGDSGLAALLEPAVAAARGDPLVLTGLIAFAAALFGAAIVAFSSSFLRASLRAAGVGAEPGANEASADRAHRFGGNVAQSLRRKEWRLLCRDHGVFAQLSLQIIYTIPLAVVLLRSADNMPVAIALAPAFVVIAAQVAASLAWITVSGEDAPELIAAAPVSRAEVETAKITAIGAPVLLILAPPLVGLALASPSVALLVAVFATAAAISTALLNLWHPMPGNRRGMLRRHSQSKLMAMLEHLLAMLWGIGVFIAVLGSVWAALPVMLAVLVLAFFRPARAPRRTDGRLGVTAQPVIPA